MPQPGERQPLVTVGEARAILALLDLVPEGTHPGEHEIAQELRADVTRRPPT